MSSKRKGRLETTKHKEKIQLFPCTVKPLVVNGSRRVLPCMATQVPIPQVLDDSSGPRQCTTKQLVVDGSERSLESRTAPKVEVGLVPCRVTPQVVNGSRRPLPGTITAQVTGDSQHPSERTTTPLVVNSSIQPLPSSEMLDEGPAPYAVKPQVVNGSRSPLLHLAVPEVDPISSSSMIMEESSATFPPPNFFPELNLVPVWPNTSYFPSLPLNQSFAPQPQSPICIYSPATYESSQPSIPLWTPLSSESRSSPVTRSSTAHSSHRISKHRTSRSIHYASPTSSPPHSKSSPLSTSVLKTSSTSFSTPLRPPTTTNNPSRTSSQAPIPVWTPAEDALLRSLVHVSRNGTNDCDPPLSWMEIAERMNAYVEQHGPLGGENDQAESGQEGGGYQQRVYHTNKLARRWGKIGG